MYFDKRMLMLVLGIMLISNSISLLSDTNNIVTLLISIPAILIAITFHEFAHGYAADKLGDDTPRRQGRLNLNPMSHLDPIGTILILFAGFGWGKPVMINPRNFDKKFKMITAEMIVSAAGPLMNFFLAIVFSIIYWIVFKYSNLNMQTGYIVLSMISAVVSINIGLGIFNLIPLPPLDGSKILGGFLSPKARYWMNENQQYFYIGFVILWISGLAGRLISPAIYTVYSFIMSGVGNLFGF